MLDQDQQTKIVQNELRRMSRLVERFILPLVMKEQSILSIGCGAGMDVAELRSLGFEAYGLDPSRLQLSLHDKGAEAYLRVGRLEDLPFGDQQFDVAYALDVIEHVGCEDFGTIAKPTMRTERAEFLRTALKVLKPGGVLYLTTSTKSCPVDVGHWHRYHSIGRLFAPRQKFGLSLPWHRDNFLPSVKDISACLSSELDAGEVHVSLIQAHRYPSIGWRGGLLSWLACQYLRFVDLGPLKGSPVAPISVFKIEKAGAP